MPLPQPTIDEVLDELESLSNPDNVAGMARYGIRPKKVFGITVSYLRTKAKQIGKNHAMALDLWKTGFHESRLLACLIADPAELSEEQLELWVSDFDSWAICDGCCNNLFDKTPFAYLKVVEWSNREEEFVKRAAFSLMVSLSVHDKKKGDKTFEEWFPLIEAAATDERNFVRKAVNWALRAIGKRNKSLNSKAIKTAEQIREIDSKSARWIAKDALRELGSEKVQIRLNKSNV